MARPKTTSTGEIVPRSKAEPAPQAERSALAAWLQSPLTRTQMEAAVPTHIRPERILRLGITALRTTRNLSKCDPLSFMGCILQAGQLGLELNTPLQHCWLIPRARWDKQTNTIVGYECTFMMGYQGMIDLALRPGKVTSIVARSVHKGDTFDFDYGLEQYLIHKPARGSERGPLTDVYATGRIGDAEPVFEVLDLDMIHQRRARSDAYRKGFGPWISDFVPMARKSGVRALWPWLPKSSEMAASVAVEQAHERSTSRDLEAFDPMVADLLERQGLAALDEGQDDGEPDVIEKDESEERAAYRQLVDRLSAIDGPTRETVDRIVEGAPGISEAVNELRKLDQKIAESEGNKEEPSK